MRLSGTVSHIELVLMVDTLREHALAADLAGARSAEAREGALHQAEDLLRQCSPVEWLRLVRHCRRLPTFEERDDG